MLELPESEIEVPPFLKWAGGKRWFANNHLALLPDRFERYVEPFLGSGALFFRLRPPKALLADLNEELMSTYRAIADDFRQIKAKLQEHNRRHSNSYYYHVRASEPRLPATKAARLIYLNRTCWNGLYRVNLRGQFNVPRGTKDSVILPTDNFEKIAELLKTTTLM